MEHHKLDPYPLPKEKLPLYINEPWMIDKSIIECRQAEADRMPDQASDNIRVYLPIDLNKTAILRRLHRVIAQYQEALYKNEMEFWVDTQMLVSQIEIYDQIWYVRHMPKEGNHSLEAKELVKEFVGLLKEIPDAGAETFPFELIEELAEEFGVQGFIQL